MTIGPEHDAPRPADGRGFSDAITVAFGDGPSELYGVARLGLSDGGASGSPYADGSYAYLCGGSSAECTPGTGDCSPGGNSNMSSDAGTGEAVRACQLLAENGQVKMPIQQTFWAERFGMLTDRFGTPWMINFEKKQ